MHPNQRLSSMVRIAYFMLILVLPVACRAAYPSATRTPERILTTTPIDTQTATPTHKPMIMCTPPPCWEDEVYFCPGECPGGCGTGCATRTPNPIDSPTPTIPPFEMVCVLPTAEPAVPLEARMAVCSSQESIHVGDVVQIAIEIYDLKRSDFVRIEGHDIDGSGYFSARGRTGGHSAVPVNIGAHLNLDWIQSQEDRLFLVLMAQSAGAVKIDFQVIPTVPDVQASITIIVLP